MTTYIEIYLCVLLYIAAGMVSLAITGHAPGDGTSFVFVLFWPVWLVRHTWRGCAELWRDG